MPLGRWNDIARLEPEVYAVTTDRHERLRTLFDEACEVPVDERAALIAERCGEDEALAAELRRLLAHDEGPLGILEAAPEIEVDSGPSVDEVAVERVEVPGYTIERKLGQGGFGVVYEAQQLRPVRRSVALKLIQHGFTSSLTKQRFAIECDALARLNHPFIARVFDAGSTPSGHLFCTMELVDGLSICDYANEHGLTATERIELILGVCDAIQHAHQRGILHRDLKPSNILVTEVDGNPVPKIIDFGIAKIRDDDDAQAHQLTMSGEFVGTPVYMSPEQADPAHGGLDTRSDVYSIAVVLYELLTGSPPLQSNRSERPSLEAVLRTLREDDAPLASKRLRDLAEEGERHAARCATRGDALSRFLVGDLDRILAMALEKDRSRRYESPQQFGADLQRFLNNEAVLAQSPTTSYLLRKFARRHRGKLTVGAVTLALLVLGIIGTSIGMANALDAQAKEAEQRRIAELEARTSGEINAFLNEDLFASVSPEGLGIDVTMREVLDTASAKIGERFVGIPEVEVALRTTLGATYRALGDNAQALQHLAKACALVQQHLEADDVRSIRARREHGATLYTAGRYEEAATTLRDVLHRSQQVLGADHQDTIAAAFHLASAYAEDPDQSKARALVEEWLPVSCSALGTEHLLSLQFSFGQAHILLAEGDPVAALAVFEKTMREARTSLGVTHRLTLMLTNEIARTKIQLGKSGEAEGLLRDAWVEAIDRLGRGHPTTLNLATSLLRCLVGDPDRKGEARLLLDELVEGWSKALRADHPTALSFWELAGSMYENLGEQKLAHSMLEKIASNATGVPPTVHMRVLAKLAAIAERVGDQDAALAWKARLDEITARTTGKR